VVKTQYGKISVGRISSDFNSAGLQTLGYIPSWGVGAQGFIFDVDSENDGIMYRYDHSSGFGLKAFFIKKSSTVATTQLDADNDRYSFEPYYKWANGGASFAIQYDRDMNAIGGVYPEQNSYFSINPAFIQSFEISEGVSLALHAEAKISRGSRKINAATEKVTTSGAGVYADITLNYPSGNTSLAGWWFDGNSSTTQANRDHTLVEPGEGFYPFAVFFQGTPLSSGARSFGSLMQPNHWGIGILGNHKITDSFTVNYGVGSFYKSKSLKNAEGKDISKHMGTEFDLGFVAKLMDNIQFSSKLGVFSTGAYYKEAFGENNDSTVVGWGNEFIFSF
jgi:hypothetical protein